MLVLLPIQHKLLLISLYQVVTQDKLYDVIVMKLSQACSNMSSDFTCYLSRKFLEVI
jgi:hypothetical protein